MSECNKSAQPKQKHKLQNRKWCVTFVEPCSTRTSWIQLALNCLQRVITHCWMARQFTLRANVCYWNFVQERSDWFRFTHLRHPVIGRAHISFMVNPHRPMVAKIHETTNSANSMNSRHGSTKTVKRIVCGRETVANNRLNLDGFTAWMP